MNNEIEIITSDELKQDWKTQYLRYRTGRLKHQYWLTNRKNKNFALIDEYDYKILKNCKEEPSKDFFLLLREVRSLLISVKREVPA